MAKTLTEKLRELGKDLHACGLLRRAGVVAELVKEAENLELAVVAFDTILFPGDQDGDPGEALHKRNALVTDLADAMDRHGWAGTLVENIELVERITNLKGKVLVKTQCGPIPIKATYLDGTPSPTRYYAELIVPESGGFGYSETEALADLQRKVDAL